VKRAASAPSAITAAAISMVLCMLSVNARRAASATCCPVALFNLVPVPVSTPPLTDSRAAAACAPLRGRPDPRVRHRSAAARPQAERAQYGLGQLGPVGEAGQFHERGVVRAPARRLHREPGLPGTPRAGQGDQPLPCEQVTDLRELGVAADEAGEAKG